MIQKRPIRSFVHRGRRLYKIRNREVGELWHTYVIDEKTEKCTDLRQLFNNKSDIDFAIDSASPINIEIGFGDGENLYAMAAAHPEENFIGIEVYRPGVALLLAKLEQHPLPNIRIFVADAIVILQKFAADASIDRIMIFFPDPWPKRRHNKRRLIQSQFVDLIRAKLKNEGILHIATDHADYAEHILKVMKNRTDFRKFSDELANINPKAFVNYRTLTKFERRGIKEGRQIVDLIFNPL